MRMKKFIPVEVRPKQGSKTVVKQRYGKFVSQHYTDRNVSENAEELANGMRRAYSPDEPYSGLLGMRIVFVSPKRSKDSKRDAYTWKETRPDIDNLCKQALDCMIKAGWLKDDSIVVDLHAMKVTGHEPGLWVASWPISNPANI